MKRWQVVRQVIVACTLFAGSAIATLLLLSFSFFPSDADTRLKPQTPQETTSEPQTISQIPPISSKVKKAKVLGSRILRFGQPDAVLELTVYNKSAKPVTAVTFVVGDLSFGKEGDIFSDEPTAIIEPFGTTTIEIALSNFREDDSIVLSAVLYTDGTGGGEKQTLSDMRIEREQIKAKRARQREVP